MVLFLGRITTPLIKIQDIQELQDLIENHITDLIAHKPLQINLLLDHIALWTKIADANSDMPALLKKFNQTLYKNKSDYKKDFAHFINTISPQEIEKLNKKNSFHGQAIIKALHARNDLNKISLEIANIQLKDTAFDDFDNLSTALHDLHIEKLSLPDNNKLPSKSSLEECLQCCPKSLQKWGPILSHAAEILGGKHLSKLLDKSPTHRLEYYIQTAPNTTNHKIVALCKAYLQLAEKIEAQALKGNNLANAPSCTDNQLWNDIIQMTQLAENKHNQNKINQGFLSDECIKQLHKMQYDFITRDKVEDKLNAVIDFFQNPGNHSILFAQQLQKAQELQELHKNLKKEFNQLKKDRKIYTRASNYSDYYLNHNTEREDLNTFHEKIKAITTSLGTTEEIFRALKTTNVQSSHTNDPHIFKELYDYANAKEIDTRKNKDYLTLSLLIHQYKSQESELLQSIDYVLDKKYSSLKGFFENITLEELLILNSRIDLPTAETEQQHIKSITKFIKDIIKFFPETISTNNDTNQNFITPYYSNKEKIIKNAQERLQKSEYVDIKKMRNNLAKQEPQNVSSPHDTRSQTAQEHPPQQDIHAQLLKGAKLTKIFKTYEKNKSLHLSARIYMSNFVKLSQQKKYQKLKDKNLLEIIELYQDDKSKYNFLPKIIKSILPNLDLNAIDLSQHTENDLQAMPSKFEDNGAVSAYLLTHRLSDNNQKLDEFIDNYIYSCDAEPSQDELQYLLRLKKHENQFAQFKKTVLQKYANLPKISLPYDDNMDSKMSITELMVRLYDRNVFNTAPECYQASFNRPFINGINNLLTKLQLNKLKSSNASGEKLERFIDLCESFENKLENANFMQLMCLYYMIKEGYTTTKNEQERDDYLSKLQQVIACFPIEQYAQCMSKSKSKDTQNKELYKLAKYCFENNILDTSLQNNTIPELNNMRRFSLGSTLGLGIGIAMLCYASNFPLIVGLALLAPKAQELYNNHNIKKKVLPNVSWAVNLFRKDSSCNFTYPKAESPPDELPHNEQSSEFNLFNYVKEHYQALGKCRNPQSFPLNQTSQNFLQQASTMFSKPKK